MKCTKYKINTNQYANRVDYAQNQLINLNLACENL